MGIFNSFIGGPSVDAPVVEGYSEEIEGGYLAVTESYEDQLALIHAVYEMDTAEMAFQRGEISGAKFEAIYEASVGTFFEKAKAGLQKLWGKIKAFFETILRRLRAMFGDTKKFVDRYDSDLRKLNLNGFKFRKFDYADFGAVIKKVEDFQEKQKKSNASLYNIARAAVTKKSGTEESRKADLEESRKINNDEKKIIAEQLPLLTGDSSITTTEKLNKAIYSQLRGGAKGPEDAKEKDFSNIGPVLDEIKETPELIKGLEDARKELDEIFKEGIERIEELADAVANAESGKETSKFEEGGKTHTVDNSNKSLAVTFIRSQNNIINHASSAVNSAISAVRTAIEERNGVNKKIINKALTYKEKK